ncbi:sensor histidine kinase [Permianibacter sp. IMCC34836]|uniref:sensor histidine kinase n=1 Tax=Permianibacter fluminis TaxID=2738515 RepID=UPI001552146D|nr:sensor histidine kinase [Permianibacter fluminis]NQD35636.1 sensor histidine kinase [Permianibacter fluminis]
MVARQTVWAWLRPPKERGIAPWLYLVYALFLFFHHIFRPFDWALLSRDLAVLAVFLPAYLISWRLPSRWLPVPTALMMALGFLAAEWNPGAPTLFIYAASLSVNYHETRQGLRHVLLVLLVLAVWSWLRQPPIWVWAPGLAMTAVIGFINVFEANNRRGRERLLRQQEEIEYLAGLAERERIARDLHDLLGHTLSLITLKAELAGKLLARNPDHAKAEIRDIETAARDALQEVRDAVTGYRGSGLQQELKRVAQALQVVGIEQQIQVQDLTLPPAIENVLSFVLREAVTNVIRHARAQHCAIRLYRADRYLELSIQDDGSQRAGNEGNGLRGMRERIITLNGEFEFASGDGHCVRVRIPMTPQSAQTDLAQAVATQANTQNHSHAHSQDNSANQSQSQTMPLATTPNHSTASSAGAEPAP